MRHYFLIVLLLILVQVTSNGQSVPGYLGKKNTIQIGPSFAALGVQPAWHMSYHRTITRHAEIGLQYYNVSGDILKGALRGTVGSSNFGSSYRINYESGPDPGKLSVDYVGIDYRRYFNAYLAPLGTSIELGLGRMMVKGVDSATIRGEITQNGPVVSVDAEQTYTHISLGANQKWIISGGMLFIEIGATANYFWTSEFQKDNGSGFYATEAELFASAFKDDFILRNLLHAKLSFGYTF